MNLIQGNVIGTGMKVAIVASRFNEFIVNKLLAGAEDGLVRHGVAGEDIDAYWVPGRLLSCRCWDRSWLKAEDTTR